MDKNFRKAVFSKDFDRIEMLLNNGLDINECDSDGETALLKLLIPIKSVDEATIDMVKYLISKGADVNVIENGQHWTPLHFASRSKSLEVIKILLANGAKVDAIDAEHLL